MVYFSGLSAENCIHAGKARRITREECYEILRKAEEKGFVHELQTFLVLKNLPSSAIATGLLAVR